jgi:ATP-dependent Zn protease
VNPKILRIGFIVLFILLAAFICGLSLARAPRGDEWTLSAVAEAAREGRIERIVVTSTDELHITLDDGSTVFSTKDPNGTALDQLQDLGVTEEQLSQIEWEIEGEPSAILTAVVYVLPLLITVGVTVWLVRRLIQQNKPPAPGDNS